MKSKIQWPRPRHIAFSEKHPKYEKFIKLLVISVIILFFTKRQANSIVITIIFEAVKLFFIYLIVEIASIVGISYYKKDGNNLVKDLTYDTYSRQQIGYAVEEAEKREKELWGTISGEIKRTKDGKIIIDRKYIKDYK